MQSKKGVVIRRRDIDATLGAQSTQGKRLLEPLRSLAGVHDVPINILEDNNVVNRAEVHKHEADLWQCLEGEVTFVYDGELVNPVALNRPDGSIDEREWSGDEIRGGIEAVLKPGDWLWIPAGVPHQHKCSSIARLIIIKVPVGK